MRVGTFPLLDSKLFQQLLRGTLLGALLLAAPSRAGELLVTNVTLIDGAGNPPVPDARVLIRDGVIAAIGDTAQSEHARAIDGGGGTLLPGLIDAHTHLTSVPGSAFRDDSAEFKRCQRKRQLQAYLAAGVTRVLDTASPTKIQQEIRAHLAAGGTGPAVHFLAPFFTPPEGYMGREDIRGADYAELGAPVDDRAAVAAQLDAASPDSEGVKVVMEPGVAPVAAFPVHSAQMRQVIREEARKRGVDVYVHSMSNDMHRLALEMAPHALVHVGYQTEEPDSEVVRAVRDSGAYAMSTIAISDFMTFQFDPRILDDPWLQRLVPEAQLATARDPAAWEAQVEGMVEAQMPQWFPTWLLHPVLGFFYSGPILEEMRSTSMVGVKAFYDAGIPIVMGADAGNWPLFVSFFHGVGSIREMELLAEAGIPPLAVIEAATQTPAKMLHIADRVGTVEVGKRADLILSEANPLDDMQALRRLRWVILAGIAKRPAEWITLHCSRDE